MNRITLKSVAQANDVRPNDLFRVTRIDTDPSDGAVIAWLRGPVLMPISHFKDLIRLIDYAKSCTNMDSEEYKIAQRIEEYISEIGASADE